MQTEIYNPEEEQSIDNVSFCSKRRFQILPRKSFHCALSLDKRPHQCHYQLEIGHETYFPRRFPVTRRFIKWLLC